MTGRTPTHKTTARVRLILLTLVPKILFSHAFFLPNNIQTWQQRSPSFFSSQTRERTPATLAAVPRYGPNEEAIPTKMDDIPDEFFDNQEDWERADKQRTIRLQEGFDILLKRVTEAPVDDLPSILSSNIEFLLSMRGYEGVNLLKSALTNSIDTEEEEKVTMACDYIVNFTEEFVNQAKEMDMSYKTLLGDIIKAMSSGKEKKGFGGKESAGGLTEREREEKLDAIMSRQKENFTPGFLRYVEGECTRIESAKKMTEEALKMLETVRLIQVRVVEELGKDLGEEAQVLGQLLGYEKREERLAVLEAGLIVRGIDFGKNMSSLLEEALDDFKQINEDDETEGKVDAELVEMVSEMNEKIKKFLDSKK